MPVTKPIKLGGNPEVGHAKIRGRTDDPFRGRVCVRVNVGSRSRVGGEWIRDRGSSRRSAWQWRGGGLGWGPGKWRRDDALITKIRPDLTALHTNWGL